MPSTSLFSIRTIFQLGINYIGIFLFISNITYRVKHHSNVNKIMYLHFGKELKYENYKPQVKPNTAKVEEAIELMGNAKRPIFYTGGGVINSGPEASHLLKEFVLLTGFPITSTLMGGRKASFFFF